MKESSRWKIDYDDGLAILFSRVEGPEAQLASAGDANPRTEGSETLLTRHGFGSGTAPAWSRR
jgi:hypothetical protein